MESSSMPPAASKVIQTNNKEVHEELVSITEKNRSYQEAA
jgi:hypothetical protein